MFARPFECERKRTAWQVAFDDLQGPDVNQRFVLGVEGVEVGRRMIQPEHLNDDTIKCVNVGIVALPRTLPPGEAHTC